MPAAAPTGRLVVQGFAEEADKSGRSSSDPAPAGYLWYRSEYLKATFLLKHAHQYFDQHAGYGEPGAPPKAAASNKRPSAELSEPVPRKKQATAAAVVKEKQYVPKMRSAAFAVVQSKPRGD